MERARRVCAHVVPDQQVGKALEAKPCASLKDAGISFIMDIGEDMIGGIGEAYKKMPNDTLAGFYTNFGREAAFVAKPEDVTAVLTTYTEHFLWGGIRYSSEAFFGDKVAFVLEGEEWTQCRRLLRAPLMAESVPKMTDQMSKAALKTLDKLRTKHGQVVNMKYIIDSYHFQSAGETMFSTDIGAVDAIDKGGHALIGAFNEFVGELLMRSFNPDEAVSVDYKTDNELNQKFWAIRDKAHAAIAPIMKRRIEKREKGNDMFDRMLAAHEKELGKKADYESFQAALGANALELFFAGYNTVCNSMAAIWWYMSKDPKIHQRVVDEVNQVLGSRQAPTEADLPKLKYCAQCFMECLRLCPPAPMIARLINTDFTLSSGKTIPAGTEVMMPLGFIHLDERYWPNPLVFNPDNFSKAWKRGTFVPFSDGARSCMGQHFAQIEFCVMLATFIRKVKLTPPADMKFGINFGGFGWRVWDETTQDCAVRMKVQRI